MENRINIFLDDLRICPDGFVLAKTVADALKLINENKIGVISLDHDLGVDDDGNLLPTGYDLVKHICEFGINANEIYLHTDNPVGRDNMYQSLVRAKARGIISKDTGVYHYPIDKAKY